MKEATGEANMTIVTVILIAAIVVIATPIVKSMMESTRDKTCCMDAGGVFRSGKCYSVGADGTQTEMTGYKDTCKAKQN